MVRYIIPVVLLLLTISCTMGNDIKDGVSFGNTDNEHGKKFTLSFERGKNFLTIAKLKMAKLKIMPQIAVWLEDTSGTYIKTIYVTHCFAKQEWRFVKPNPDVCFRTMCMPYWFNRYQAAGNSAPTSGKPLPDAVTGATPTGSFTINFTIPDSVTNAVVLAEWNSSFDNNDTFTKDSTGFNGQPSVVQRVRINLGDTAKTEWTLLTAGHGGNRGSDATLYTTIDKLTSATSIFDRVTVKTE